MISVGTFQATFPEFASVDPTIIQAQITRAALWVAPNVWKGFTDQGVGTLAAHYLTQMPGGTTTATVPGRSTYLDQFEEMRAAIVGGFVGGGTWR